MKVVQVIRRTAGKVVVTAVVLALVVPIASALLSCGSPGDNGSPRSGDGPRNPAPGHAAGEGTIRVSLPGNIFGGGIGAAAVDTATAQADAEILEILVLEEYPAGDPGSDTELTVGDQPTVAASMSVATADIAEDLSTGSSVPLDISVAPGTYRLLVLAGTESGSTSCLLASGYTTTPVTVEDKQTSQVTVDLTTISHEITVPETIVAGDTYTINASGDTNNPVLTTDSEGSTDTYRFQAKFDTESSLGVLDADFSGTGWTVGHSTTAPASEQDGNWYSAWMFAGPYITYKDSNTSAWIVMDGDLSRKWRWLSYTVLGQSAELWQEVAAPVTLQPSTTGMAIEVTWS